MGKWRDELIGFVSLLDFTRDGCPNFLTIEEKVYAQLRWWKSYFIVVGIIVLSLCFWMVAQWGGAYERMVEKKEALESYAAHYPVEPLLAKEKKYQTWVRQLQSAGKVERSKHRQLLYMVVLAPQGLQLKNIHFTKTGFVVEGRTTRQDVLENYVNCLRVSMKGVELRENSHQDGQGGLFSFRLEGREKTASPTVDAASKKNSARQ